MWLYSVVLGFMKPTIIVARDLTHLIIHDNSGTDWGEKLTQHDVLILN